MGTKVKGLFKGFKYISQIFDEPKKEAAFQIGMPTDVKHVAHIGWDNNGPAADSPSWMKGFESTEGGHNSAPNSVEGSSKRSADVVGDAAVIDSPKIPVAESPKKEKSSRSSGEFPKKERSRSPRKEKARTSRRRSSKSSSGSLKLNPEEIVASDTQPRDLPDIPKKSRKKKPRDPSSTRSSKDSSSTRTSKHRSVASASDRESSLQSSHSNTENESSQAG